MTSFNGATVKKPYVNLSKYDFHKVRPEDEKPPLPAEVMETIRSAAEKRMMALGSMYKQLQMTPETLTQMETDLRKAKLYEVVTTSHSCRTAELNFLREYVMHEEDREMESKQKRLVELQLLKQKAFKVLQREIESTRVAEHIRLDEDRKAILVRERSALLERRRLFEHSNLRSAGDDAQSSISSAAQGGAPVILVMNVALGNGKEERIIVRKHDDPNGIAVQFAHKHSLPDHTISTLATQIRANIAQHSHATTGRGATPTRSGGIPANLRTRSPGSSTNGSRRY